MVLSTNVLHGSPVAHNTGHSAAYPEWLPEWFIKLFSDEGDLVLDPFVGSGTTLRVAQRLGRHSVGVEIHEAIAKGLYQEFWEPLNDHVTDYVRIHTDVQAMLLETREPVFFSEMK